MVKVLYKCLYACCVVLTIELLSFICMFLFSRLLTSHVFLIERQVRILSELKGIGITDLQDALRLACEAEAHGELQNLVGKLQARVDGLQLMSGGVGGLRRAKGGGQFNEEAAARARSKC